MYDQVQQTMRQLSTGDITQQKAIMRLLKMVGQMNRQTSVPVFVEADGFKPKKAHSDDAAWDLQAAEDISVLPGQTQIVSTGVSIALPEGYEAQVRSRSGLAVKGLVVANSPGTIDAGYRGQIGVIIHNNTGQSFNIRRGDRIAQLLITELPTVVLNEVEEDKWKQISGTERGAGGFGSTGS